MLLEVPSMKRLTRVPFNADYTQLRSALDRVDPDAFANIHRELTARFNGREIDTAGWIPGALWQGTPWFPIYIAAGQESRFGSQVFWADRLASGQWTIQTAGVPGGTS
jgi:hypothetical protein